MKILKMEMTMQSMQSMSRRAFPYGGRLCVRVRM